MLTHLQGRSGGLAGSRGSVASSDTWKYSCFTLSNGCPNLRKYGRPSFVPEPCKIMGLNELVFDESNDSRNSYEVQPWTWPVTRFFPSEQFPPSEDEAGRKPRGFMTGGLPPYSE